MAERLAARGLETLMDLACFVPTGYEDRRTVTPIEDLTPSTFATVEGEIEKISWAGPPWKKRLEVHVSDGSGAVVLVWFRAARGQANRFSTGARVRASGRVASYRSRYQIAHPEVAVTEAGSSPTGNACEPKLGGVVGRYPTIEKVGNKRLRSLCRQAVRMVAGDLDDGIPAWALDPLGLPTLSDALTMLHEVPDDLDAEQTELLMSGRHPSQRRATFGELFLMQLELARQRARWSRFCAPCCPPPRDRTRKLEAIFGFELTSAQKQAIREIGAELASETPMQRLLQGDVGCGKTAVAFAAAHQVLATDRQVALMAPTEILSRQHLATLEAWSAELGFRVCLLTGDTPPPVRRSLTSLLEVGEPMLLVGTHALISESVRYGNLALVIIDEQHRFGVAQRSRLRDKAAGGGAAASAAAHPDSSAPHLLVMTATPIPRSLALTAYGDLDLSVIDELPAGRIRPRTTVYPHNRRREAWNDLKNLISRGLQAYVVCPLVAESETSEKNALADAERTATQMRAAFGQDKVGLLHGRMDMEQKQRAMADFRSGRHQLLVATTVIEVGVDVPLANVMVVINAERFGLSQLHQLRGRVGRSSGSEPHCLLVAGKTAGRDSLERLRVLARTCDGFEVAEADLEQRGPGEISGLRQAGTPGADLLSIIRDPALLSAARQSATKLIQLDPDLEAPAHARLARLLSNRAAQVYGGETG
jgi:ATP-dependent DNA helicase RecG